MFLVFGPIFEEWEADFGRTYVPGSDRPMRRRDRNGQVCHWILEVHLVDTERQIGGFFEELLHLGPGPAAAGWPG
jgi:hypothetical protein